MKVSRCSYDKMTCGHNAGSTEKTGIETGNALKKNKIIFFFKK